MVIFYPLDKPVMLVKPNPTRTKLLICNLTDTTVHVNTDGMDLVTFTNRAWPIKIDGVLAVCDGIEGYKGPIYFMTDESADIRVFEV